MLKSTLQQLARRSLGTALATAAAVGWSSSAGAQEPEPLPPLLDNSPFGSPETVFDTAGRQCGGWSASIEALWLKRKTSTDKLLAEEREFFLDSNVLNSLELDGDTTESEGAWRLTVVREFDDCSRLEFIYFELDDVLLGGSFSAVGGEGTVLISRFLGNFDAVAGDVIGFSYNSDLRNIELNHYEMIRSSGSSELSLGIGLRYLHLDEQFSLFAFEEDGSHIDRINNRTSNHMLGLQLGAMWNAQLCDRVSLGTSGKAGLLLNTASQNTERPLEPAGFVNSANPYSESDRGYGVAGVLELGVQVRGQLCDNVNLTAGYNVFYLGGMALAPDQVTPESGSGSPTVDMDGSSLYYGPSAAIEITWGGGQ